METGLCPSSSSKHVIANLYIQLSVIFILPETKGVSLERMDAIFGEIDAVEAGEEAHRDKLEMVDVKQEEVTLGTEMKG